MSTHRVLSALMFFPRGGSSHVARSLARELPSHGWDVTVLSGSVGDGPGDAWRFYRGLPDVHAVDFATPGVPMHPSYEDRPDAPDPVFASVDDATYERHVAVWERALRRAGAADADVLHLHHLTPLHEAAARVAPDVPVVGHLHGTELLMLERIASGAPDSWPFADAWAERLRRWAQACARLVVLSETQIARVEEMLGVSAERCVVLPNGFDPELFHRHDLDRAAHWRAQLPDVTPEQLDRLATKPLFLSVSRYTAVKRIPVLIEAFHEARRSGVDASLVLVGGHPGEHEGEHPQDTIARLGARDVHLAGWHEHDALAAFLSAADVFALASVREQFGQVLVEAMACAVPPIAVDRYGPGEIVDDGRTGWLVPPDDVPALRDAIVAAASDPAERLRRGENARRDARSHYSWPALAGRLATVLDEVATGAATTR